AVRPGVAVTAEGRFAGPLMYRPVRRRSPVRVRDGERSTPPRSTGDCGGGQGVCGRTLRATARMPDSLSGDREAGVAVLGDLGAEFPVGPHPADVGHE